MVMFITGVNIYDHRNYQSTKALGADMLSQLAYEVGEEPKQDREDIP